MATGDRERRVGQRRYHSRSGRLPYNAEVASNESPSGSLENARAVLTDVLSDDPAVFAAYIYGSLVRGTAGPLSDVDVGLLILDSDNAGRICDRTMDALCRRLRTSRIDVIALAVAPMPLRYRVVRDGLLVLNRDAARVERFVSETVLQYLDFKPIRDRSLSLVREAILEKR